MQSQFLCSRIMVDSAAIRPACNNASTGTASISIFDGFDNSPFAFLSTLNSMTGKQGERPFENLNPSKGTESESAENWTSFFADIENNMSQIFNQGHINNLDTHKCIIPLNSSPENITALNKNFIQSPEMFDGEGNNRPHRDLFTLLSNLKSADSDSGVPAKESLLNVNLGEDVSKSIELMNTRGVDKVKINAEDMGWTNNPLNKDENGNPGGIKPDDQKINQEKSLLILKNRVEISRSVPDSKSGEYDRQVFSVKKEIEAHPVRTDKADPDYLYRSESKQGSKTVLNRVLSANASADPETTPNVRVTENSNRGSDSQKKDIFQLQDEQVPDSGKDTGGRSVSDLTRGNRPFILDSAIMQRYTGNNQSSQKTQAQDAILNVKQWVSSESATGEETTLASNHQNPDKSSGSVVNAKEVHHFDKSFQPTVMKQVVEKAVHSLKEGQSSIRLSLRPDVLGHLKMHISTENSQVSIRIIAEVPMVRDIIESNLTQLKADFQNQGLEIEKFDVSVGQGSTDNNRMFERLPFEEKRPGEADGTVKSDFSEDAQEIVHHSGMQSDSSLIDYFV